eukprot:scaffold7039_cov255-Pinguiococcus_pyrenoidosus.AAC.6
MAEVVCLMLVGLGPLHIRVSTPCVVSAFPARPSNGSFAPRAWLGVRDICFSHEAALYVLLSVSVVVSNVERPVAMLSGDSAAKPAITASVSGFDCITFLDCVRTGVRSAAWTIMSSLLVSLGFPNHPSLYALFRVAVIVSNIVGPIPVGPCDLAGEPLGAPTVPRLDLVAFFIATVVRTTSSRLHATTGPVLFLGALETRKVLQTRKVLVSVITDPSDL